MRSTLDIGLEALIATDNGASSAVAVMGAVAVGAVALGVVRVLRLYSQNTGKVSYRLPQPGDDRGPSSDDQYRGEELSFDARGLKAISDHALEDVLRLLDEETSDWRDAIRLGEVKPGEMRPQDPDARVFFLLPEGEEDDSAFTGHTADIREDDFYGLSPSERAQHLKELSDTADAVRNEQLDRWKVARLLGLPRSPGGKA